MTERKLLETIIDKIESMDQRFDQIDKRFGDMDKRFETIDKRFDTMDKRFETIDKRFGDIDKRFETIDKRFDTMDKRFETIDKRFDTMDKRFETIDKRFDTMDKRFGDIDKRFETMDKRIGQLVHHVAEVRQSNVRLEAAVKQMQDDIRALDTKIDERTDFLASKIDHFVEHFSIERGRDRARLEEERHLRLYAQKETEKRLAGIEHRLERLEAASS